MPRIKAANPSRTRSSGKGPARTAKRNRSVAAAARNSDRVAGEAAPRSQRAMPGIAEGAQRMTDQMNQIFDMAGRQGGTLFRQSTQSVEAVAEAGTVLARGASDLSREWFAFVQGRMQKNVASVSALARCRSVSDILAVQTEIVSDSLQDAAEAARKLAEVTARAVNEADEVIASARQNQRVA